MKVIPKGAAPPGSLRPISATERISFERELEEVKAALKTIRNNYEGFQEWTEDDREHYGKLKNRKQELTAMLGRVV